MELMAIGSEDFTIGFRLVGMRALALPMDQLEGALARALEDENMGIVILSREGFEALGPDVRQAALESVRPVVIAIGAEEDAALREMVRRIVGVDLLASPGGG